MKTIRLGAFETNSSSTHTIVIPRNQKTKLEILENRGEPKVLVATIGEYGWEWETHYDLLSYIYTGICCVYDDKYEKYTKKIEEVAEQYNIKIEWEKPDFSYSYDDDGKVRYCYLDNGYIDHSDDLEDFLEDLFQDNSLLLDAIINGYVRTGNDNDLYDEDEDEEETDEDCYYYYKGN